MRTKVASLEVIAGPMFSGKTEELIRQVKRAAIAKKRVQVFKPALDSRYGKGKELHSHNGQTYESELITKAQDILDLLDKKTEIVAIDEAQWFGKDLIRVVHALLRKKIRVLVAGLAMTFDRQPFEPTPTLMAMADRVSKLSAVCYICGEEAVFHKRVTKNTKNIDAKIPDPSFVSKLDVSVFQARCHKCFSKRP
jgi:thymidine kinase